MSSFHFDLTQRNKTEFKNKSYRDKRRDLSGKSKEQLNTY